MIWRHMIGNIYDNELAELLNLTKLIQQFFLQNEYLKYLYIVQKVIFFVFLHIWVRNSARAFSSLYKVCNTDND